MSHPQICIDIHVDYVRAGADIITTNTFSSGGNMMAPAGLGDEARDTTLRAVELAKQARDKANVDRDIAIAGSMSHQVPIIEGSRQRDLARKPSAEQSRRYFEEHARALSDGGVDFIMMEMMSDPDLAVPAIESATGTGLPVWIGLSVDKIDGRLMSHARHEISFDDCAREILAAGGEVAGIMHSAMDTVIPGSEVIRKYFDGPLMAYPDSGDFKMPDWQFENVISPSDFAAQSKTWRDYGITAIGGCCGLGLDHIHVLSET